MYCKLVTQTGKPCHQFVIFLPVWCTLRRRSHVMASSTEKGSECNFQSSLKDIQLKLNKIECDNGEIKERLYNFKTFNTRSDLEQ